MYFVLISSLYSEIFLIFGGLFLHGIFRITKVKIKYLKVPTSVGPVQVDTVLKFLPHPCVNISKPPATC